MNSHAASMASVGSSNALLNSENCFWNSLLILGFDPDLNSKKHGIPFTADMFRKNNVKGMEVIFYFLFSKISPAKTKDLFRALWPVYDKNQAREFKKNAFTFLSQLEKEGAMPANTVRLSLIQTCGGDKFYQLLWHLSTYTMKTVLQRDYPKYTIPFLTPVSSDTNPRNLHTIYKATLTHCTLQSKKFVKLTQRMEEMQAKWHSFAQSLRQDHDKLLDEMASLNYQRQQLHQREDRHLLSQEAGVKREKMIEDIRKVWKFVEEQYDHVQSNKDLMDTMLEKKDRPTLDAKQLYFVPPHGYAELNEKPFNSNGQMDIKLFLKQWNFCLSKIKEEIQKASAEKGSLSDIKVAEKFEQYSQAHQAHLINICKLKESLSEQLKESDEAISSLQIELESMINQKKGGTSNTSQVARLRRENLNDKIKNLQFIPPTPIRVNQYDAAFVQSTPGRLSARRSYIGPSSPSQSAEIDNPEVMNRLMQSVRRVAKRIPPNCKTANAIIQNADITAHQMSSQQRSRPPPSRPTNFESQLKQPTFSQPQPVYQASVADVERLSPTKDFIKTNDGGRKSTRVIKKRLSVQRSELIKKELAEDGGRNTKTPGHPSRSSPRQNSPGGKIIKVNDDEQLSMFMSSQSQKTLMEDGDDYLMDELSDDLFESVSPSEFVPSPILAATEEGAWNENVSSQHMEDEPFTAGIDEEDPALRIGPKRLNFAEETLEDDAVKEDDGELDDLLSL
eukprot:TRINITY_DN2942_c0_g1_i1.p1 TRINITY_DN2942_c0_g1~~TRINITY_DN2942_c0_g1_i1.p1  ORF type:complete len:743 (-),score=208.01 TRINITY_DN2942_c0_g1_i1:26-2218(-)